MVAKDASRHLERQVGRVFNGLQVNIIQDRRSFTEHRFTVFR